MTNKKLSLVIMEDNRQLFFKSTPSIVMCEPLPDDVPAGKPTCTTSENEN